MPAKLDFAQVKGTYTERGRALIEVCAPVPPDRRNKDSQESSWARSSVLSSPLQAGSPSQKWKTNRKSVQVGLDQALVHQWSGCGTAALGGGGVPVHGVVPQLQGCGTKGRGQRAW